MRRLARRLAATFVRRGRTARPVAEPPPAVRGSARPSSAAVQPSPSAWPLWRCAAAAMPGRNKATSNCGCPELTMGQQIGASGPDARDRSEEEEERGNIGDPAIVKSPSDPKQYR